MVYAQAGDDHLFLSKDEEDGEKKGSAPRGFEKFLKKTRKGVTKTEDNKEAEADKEKQAKKSKDDDDEASEEEEPAPKKEKKQGFQLNSDINDFFFQPNGKGPKWENFGIIGGLIAAITYLLLTRETSS